MIFYNGNIKTMDKDKPQVEAMVVKEDKIIKVGSNEEILSVENEDEIIDLMGKTVIPGLNDSHMHLYSFGVSLEMVNLMNVSSVTDLINQVKEFIQKHHIKPGQWISGRGWNQDYFTKEKQFPTCYDLDKISTDHPIVLSRACGHVIVVNSKAMEICGISKETKQIEGGKFDVDGQGRPLGIFREQALSLILDYIPQPSVEKIKETLVKGMRYANSKGLTSIQTDDLSHVPHGNFKLMLQAYEELNKEGLLTCRIYEQCLLNTKEKLKEFLKCGYKTGIGDHYFKIGPFKILSDGSLGARTAYLSKPYHDDLSTQGMMCFTRQELDDIIMTAHCANMQIAVHCIGDEAMNWVLNSYQKALKEKKRDNHRHGIIHCQIMNEKIMDQFKAFDILAYIQPIFLHYDIHIVENRVGKRLAKTSYAFNSLIKRNIHTSIGTDCPVEALDTMPNIHCVVTREDLTGYPHGGWNPQEKLSVEEAIYHYTQESAYASFEENIKGSITEGKLADFIVLDQDLFSADKNSIKDIEILMTYVGGKLVYQKNS